MPKEGDHYLFPFNTCETFNSQDDYALGVAQPYSAFVNFLSSLYMLFFMLFTAKKYNVKRCAMTFILFELFHTYSHIAWISWQRYVVHLFGYIMGFVGVYPLLYRQNDAKRNSTRGHKFITMAVLLDMSIVWYTNLKGIWGIGTGLVVLTSIVLPKVNELPVKMGTQFVTLSVGTLVLFFLFVIESQFCAQMLRSFDFPFHVIVEVWGSVLFVLLCQTIKQFEHSTSE